MGVVTPASDPAEQGLGGGLEVLAAAAVPEDVRQALSARLCLGTKQADAVAGTGSNDLADFFRALATPPRAVSLRLTGGDHGAVDGLLGERLRAEAGSGFEASALAALPEPVCWLACPDARVVRAVGAPDAASFERALSPDAVDVIIDAACGMAVLRGADVFCMGVMASSRPFPAGAPLNLWVVPEGSRAPNRGAFVEAPSAWPAVLVASGEAALSRAAILAEGASGLAIRVLRRRDAALPLAPMNAVLADPAGELGRATVLQQLPSCAVVCALAPRPGERVLDMCAAPGGKTTHLAQLLGSAGQGLVSVDRSLSKARRVAALCEAHGFSAVRCLAQDSRYLCSATPGKESAASEAAPAPQAGGEGEGDEAGAREGAPDQRLAEDTAPWPEEAVRAFDAALEAHGAGRFRSAKRIYKAVVAAVGRESVSRLQVNARLRQAKGDTEATLEAAAEQRKTFPPGSFDKILLDPPCSALGQRPLLRWGNTYKDVEDHASYQRHFLRTAAALLRPGGEMVYSTCTLTAEENEENVRWALDSLPLELLDAREHSMTEQAKADGRALPGLAGCGLDEAQRQLVLRFDPRDWDVGFFAARFRRSAQQP